MEVSSIIQGEVFDDKVGQNVVPEVSSKQVKVIVNEGSENLCKGNSVSNVIESALKAIGNKKARLTLHIDLMSE